MTDDASSDSSLPDATGSVRPPAEIVSRSIVEQVRRSWPIALALTSLTLLSMARFIRYANADVLVSTLISTERLTFFYWGQDRLASLVPLLAWPVQDVRLNFYVQALIQGWAFFGLVLLFVEFHLVSVRDGVDRHADATTTAIALLLGGLAATQFVSAPLAHVFVFEQQYALSLLLFLLGVIVIMRAARRIAPLGAFLLVTSLAVIPSTVLFAPVAALVPTDRGRWQRVGAVGLASVAAFLASVLLARVFGPEVPATDLYADFSPDRLVHNAGTAFRSIRATIRPAPTMAMLIGVAVSLVLQRHRLTREAWLATVGAPLFAFAWFAVFASNGWVEANLYHPRYFFPVYLVVIFPVCSVASTLARLLTDRFVEGSDPTTRARTDRARTLRVGTVATSVALAAFGVGRLVSDDGILAVGNATPAADIADRLDVEFVVGPYFEVWPIVFSARSRGDDLLAVTLRSEAIVALSRELIDDAAVDGGVQLMCIRTDAPSCAAQLSFHLDEPWTVSDTLIDDPLVIEVSRSTAEGD